MSRCIYNLRKRNLPSDTQNGEQIASAQNEDIETEKAVTNVQCMETTIPGWDPAENIARDHEDFYKPEGAIELRIDRFTEFAHSELRQKRLPSNQWRWSASTYIRGLAWKLCADIWEKENPDKQSVQSSNNERFLGLLVYCNKDSASIAWNCQAVLKVRALAQKECVDNFEGTGKVYFSRDRKCGGDSYFMPINTLLDPEKGFIKDDIVILQAFVKAEMPYGIEQVQDACVNAYLGAFGPIDKTQLYSSSAQLQSNFILVVQDKEVHVRKSFLSMHSKYFNEQFAKHENGNKAVLQNIDYNEFLELLAVIYPSRYPITAENIETISKLAHIFKMTDLLRQCEAFLLVNSGNFGKVKLLLMAQWYNLEHLQAKCFGEYKTANDLKQLRKEQEFDGLDCRMKAVLLDKFVQVNTSAATPATSHNETSDQRAVSSTKASEILNGLVSSNSVPTDTVLIVENKRISIHKLYLSIYSEYFKAMLMGEFQEKNQEEIVLEEVHYADILELLAIIYPTDSPITEENIEAVLNLADRFIMPSILEKCKKALKCSSTMKASLKLWLAQRYKFSDLQIELAQRYKSAEDVKKLKAEPEYGLLDVKTLALIFDSISS